MQIVLEGDEAWSLMMTISAYAIDNSGISAEGKQKVRHWRSGRADGTAEMQRLSLALNGALGTMIEEKTTRQVRRRGRYTSSRQRSR